MLPARPAVVHMGTDPAGFIDLFDVGHWFDMQAYTTEDLGRAQAYAARAAALAEQFMLRRLTDIAKGMGAIKLVGEYRATPKNDVVADLYPRIGFSVRANGLYERPLGGGPEDWVTYIAGV